MQAEIDYLLRTGNFDMQKYFAREAKSVYLSDFVQEYLEYIHNRKKYKPGAIQTYEYSLQFLMEIIGDIPLNRVNRVLVDKKILPALEGRLATATVRHHIIKKHHLERNQLPESVVSKEGKIFSRPSEWQKR